MVKPTRITNTIRATREAAGMTQAEVARHIGVTRQTLIAIEQGKYSPSLELAFQLFRRYRRTNLCFISLGPRTSREFSTPIRVRDADLDTGQTRGAVVRTCISAP